MTFKHVNQDVRIHFLTYFAVPREVLLLRLFFSSRYAKSAEGDVYPHSELRPESSNAQYVDPAHAGSGPGVSV